MDGGRRWFRRHRPVRITDAPPSPEQELRSRRAVYAALMAIHLSGLIAAGLLYRHWILALAIVVVTGALPWVAVVVANDRRVPERPSRPSPTARQAPRDRPAAGGDDRPGLPGGRTPDTR